MKLLWSTKSKINENKNGENVPYLKINKVVLISSLQYFLQKLSTKFKSLIYYGTLISKPYVNI